MTKKYHRIKFDLGSLPNCCGVLELGGFHYDNGDYDWVGGREVKATTFSTEEERLNDFTSCFERSLANYIAGGNDNNGNYLLIATLTDKEYNQDYPELHQWFKDQKWDVSARFKNQNTGNTVVMYQRLVDNEELTRLMDEHELEYGSGW